MSIYPSGMDCPPPLRLSQGHLTLLESCPRRFQHTVLDALAVPATPDQLAAQRWGDRFHLLMQQRELGLPIEPMLAQDPELQAVVAALVQADPDLFTPTERFRQAEHSRACWVHGYGFTAIYDLLRLWDQRGEIIDWKTYRQPRSPAVLAQDWQTRLYCYLLVATTNLAPEQVSMVYWFVRHRDPDTGAWQPQSVRLAYDRHRHDQTHADLKALGDRLSQWLAAGSDFPKIPPTAAGLDTCGQCPFAVRCQRDRPQAEGLNAIPPLDAIPELAL